MDRLVLIAVHAGGAVVAFAIGTAMSCSALRRRRIGPTADLTIALSSPWRARRRCRIPLERASVGQLIVFAGLAVSVPC